MDIFEISGKVEKFQGKAAWYFIRVPKDLTDNIEAMKVRGMIPILAKLNETEWKTSLLPYGDGSYFIALKASVRKENSIELDQSIKLVFEIA